MNAYEAILEALIVRGRTGEGADIRVSMFELDDGVDGGADALYASTACRPSASGLTHSSLAPYGVFETADDVPILISIQNDREWAVFCTKVLERARACDAIRASPTTRRAWPTGPQTDGLVARCFSARRRSRPLSRRLEEAEIAFARVNDIEGILRHPHLRRLDVGSPGGPDRAAEPSGALDGRAGPELRAAAGAGRAHASRAAGIPGQRVGQEQSPAACMA